MEINGKEATDMEKVVIRTVLSYRYTFVKLSMEGGAPQVVDTKYVEVEEKLGDRKMRAFLEAHPEMDGYVLGGPPEQVKTRYGVPLDVFMKHAIKLEDTKTGDGE